MTRSVLLDTIATMFVAVRIALSATPNYALVIHNQRRFPGAEGPGLEALFRLFAAFRSDSIPALSVVILPWKTNRHPDPAWTPNVPEGRKETKRRSRRLSQRCAADALRALLEQSEREATELRNRLSGAESELHRFERRRSRAHKQAAETALRIDGVVDRCQKLLQQTTVMSPTSIMPDTPTSPVESLPGFPGTPEHSVRTWSLETVETQIRRLREENATPKRTSCGPLNEDVDEELRRLREENMHLKRRLTSDLHVKEESWSSAASDVTNSPDSSRKLSEKHDIDEVRICAFKEVLAARSVADGLAAEVEQLRNYKTMVRDWVCRFVTQTQAEKGALVDSLHAARNEARDADALRMQLATEARARASAEASLSALRAHQAQLARELAVRNAELAATQAQMMDARDTYTRVTNLAESELAQYEELARSQQTLARRNLALRSQVGTLQERLDNTTAHLTTERDRLQESLANMANLANSTQTRLAVVERQLAEEKAKNSAANTLRRQVGRVLKVPGSPKKKKKPINRELSEKVNRLTVEVADAQTRANAAESQLRDIQNFV